MIPESVQESNPPSVHVSRGSGKWSSHARGRADAIETPALTNHCLLPFDLTAIQYRMVAADFAGRRPGPAARGRTPTRLDGSAARLHAGVAEGETRPRRSKWRAVRRPLSTSLSAPSRFRGRQCLYGASCGCEPVRLRSRGGPMLLRPRVKIRFSIAHSVAEAMEGGPLAAHAVAVQRVGSRNVRA